LTGFYEVFEEVMCKTVMHHLNLSGIFGTDEATYKFTHGILLVLTFTLQLLNASLAADGWSYFSFKCPFLHLSRTVFSVSSNKRYM
jgi:hypothetical protein